MPAWHSCVSSLSAGSASKEMDAPDVLPEEVISFHPFKVSHGWTHSSEIETDWLVVSSVICSFYALSIGGYCLWPV